MESAVSADAVNTFFAEQFRGGGTPQTVVKLARDYALIQRVTDDTNLRPGGYISGPTQMALADTAAYAVIFTRLGIVPMAVTSNLNINFMRPCIGKIIIAEARLLKLGRALAVIEVDIRPEGSDKCASHAVINYALPQPTNTSER